MGDMATERAGFTRNSLLISNDVVPVRFGFRPAFFSGKIPLRESLLSSGLTISAKAGLKTK